MSLKESSDTALFVHKDVTCDDCISDKSTAGVTVSSDESKHHPRSNENVQERLGMESLDSRSTAEIINSKKSSIYENMNGFTHNIPNNENALNGEFPSCEEGNNSSMDDTKTKSKALTSQEAKSGNVFETTAEHRHSRVSNQSENYAFDCIESTRALCEEPHSVEELIDKLASTPMSLNEDSEHMSLTNSEDVISGITYVIYESERQMPDIMRLITKDLSEPYSIYTYRYFIHNWPKLCFLAMDNDNCVGAIVCKLDVHKKMVRRGYIAMLAVDSEYRRRKIGSTLVTKAIHAMIRDDCDEVVLETEITNQAALHLYENLGFVRDKRLFRYYLNGVDALRLKLWLR